MMPRAARVGYRVRRPKRERRRMYTGCWIENNWIWGGTHSGRFWIENGWIWGPKNSGKYWIQEGYIWGPVDNGKFWIEEGHIYGPSKTLPWTR